MLWHVQCFVGLVTHGSVFPNWSPLTQKCFKIKWLDMGVVTLEESGSEFKNHWQESAKLDS